MMFDISITLPSDFDDMVPGWNKILIWKAISHPHFPEAHGES